MPENVFLPDFFPIASIVYEEPVDVTMSCATAGAQIFYTTSDTDEPTIQYTAPIRITSTATFRAVAKKSGYNDSPIATVTYNLSITGQVSAPYFEPTPTISYSEPKIVSIRTSTSGAAIYYGFGESGELGNLYIGAFMLGATTTIRAVAKKDGLANSTTTTARYDINIPTAKPAPILMSTQPSWHTPLNGQVELVWQADDDPDLTAFRIRYGRNSGVYTASVDIATKYYRAFNIRNLQENTIYYFSIQAVYGSVFGLASNELSCKTPARPKLVLNETATETSPAIDIGGASATISWQYSGDMSLIDHYKVKLSSKMVIADTENPLINIDKYIVVSPQLPSAGGFRREFTIVGLVPGIIYTISMITFFDAAEVGAHEESNKITFIKSTNLLAEVAPSGNATQLYWNQQPFNFSHSLIVLRDDRVPADENDGTVAYRGVANTLPVGE